MSESEWMVDGLRLASWDQGPVKTCSHHRCARCPLDRKRKVVIVGGYPEMHRRNMSRDATDLQQPLMISTQTINPTHRICDDLSKLWDPNPNSLWVRRDALPHIFAP